MVQVLAAVFLIVLSAVLHAQSVTFSSAQTTVPVTGLYGVMNAAVDGSGNVFAVSSGLNVAVKVAVGTGIQTTIPATGLSHPWGLAVDGSGNVFVVDGNNNRVVKVTPGGVETTVPATGLNAPWGAAVDGSGNVFIADTGNGRIVKVTPGGVQTTVPATGLNLPLGVAVDGSGNVFISNSLSNQVVKVTPGGVQSTVPATGLDEPFGVAVDGAGDVFIADYGNNRIVEVTPDGVQSNVPATGVSRPWGVAVDGSGNVFIPQGNRILEVNTVSVNFPALNICPAGQTTPAPCTRTTTLNYNVTAGGTLGTPKVLTLGAPHLDFTLAGGSTCTGAVSAGSTCTVNATFAPRFAGSRTGAVQVVDGGGKVLAATLVYGLGLGPQVGFNPSLQMEVGTGLSSQTGVAVDGAGNVFIANGGNNTVVKVAPDRTQTTVATGLSGYNTLAIDGAGNLFIADPKASRVLKVTPAGIQSTVGTGLNQPQGVAVDGAGNVFIADGNNDRVVEVPAGGGAQLTVGTGLSYPVDVAVDGTGNVYIADIGNRRVVKVPSGCAASSCQTTVGSDLNAPQAVAVDGAGNVFIADDGDDELVEVPADGSAQFTLPFLGLNQPYDLAVNGAGDIFIADGIVNNRVLDRERSQQPLMSFVTTPFGETSSDSPESVMVQNIGNQSLTAITPGLTVGPNPSFTQVAGPGTPEDCTSSFSLAAGASCNLSISFTPAEGGFISSAAVLTDNALNANPATQSIRLTGYGTNAVPKLSFSVPDQTYGAAPFAVSATSNSPGAITYSVVSGPAIISGNTVTLTGAGNVTLQASQAATDTYKAATAQTSFIVYPAMPTMSFSVPDRTYGVEPFAVKATSNSPGGISYSVVSGPATISGSTVTLTGLGTVTLLASQAATSNFTAATIQTSFTVFSQSLTTIASLTSTTAAIDVFGFGFTAPSGQLTFTDVTLGKPVAAPVTLHTSTATTSLTPQTTTSTGADTLPVWTTLGDINSDGIQDLVASLYLTDSVSVQLGNGDGTFKAATSIHISDGFGPAECHLVSLRGNGKLDLIVGSFNTNQIAVLLGRGDGTFESPVLYTVGTSNDTPTSLTTGDFNDDNNLDVAVANTEDDTVSILLGNGSGGLTPLSTPINVGRTPQAIRAGDFNGDGYSDLAVANYGDGTVTTLLNTQSGTFTANTISVGSGAGSGPQALAIHGTGSGLLLAVANSRDNTVSVLSSKGDGTFGTQKVVAVGKGPDDVNFADFNGDGAQDLVVSNYTDDTVDLLLGGGSGNYTLVGPFAVGDSPYSAAVGSLNVDGTPDIVVSNCFSNNTGVLLDGTQISVPYSGLSLISGNTLRATYTPDGASKYGSSTSADTIAPPTADRLTHVTGRVR